jgi:hypothetical protein
MVGGITMSGAFNHSVSSSRAPVMRMPSLLEENDSQKKSLSSLTGRLELSLGRRLDVLGIGWCQYRLCRRSRNRGYREMMFCWDTC